MDRHFIAVLTVHHRISNLMKFSSMTSQVKNRQAGSLFLHFSTIRRWKIFFILIEI